MADEKRERIERIGLYLSELSEKEVDRLIESGDVLRDNAFWPKTKGEFGHFYAPFDWINGNADMLRCSIAEEFEPEIATFKDAWLVPFGPVPAFALEKTADRGLVDPDRILPGVNHPSGTQWNRHNCQLNTSDDHSRCAKNVGCETIRGRSERLEAIVSSRLASLLA